MRNYYLDGSPINYQRGKNLGPQFQISYMDDFKFDPDFGWQAYATAYNGVKDMGTPNHLPQAPQWTFTLGLFGTYKFSEDQKWMIGYAYRQEKMRYRTSGPSGVDDQSTLAGNYLNLSVEFGLNDHYK